MIEVKTPMTERYSELSLHHEYAAAGVNQPRRRKSVAICDGVANSSELFPAVFRKRRVADDCRGSTNRRGGRLGRFGLTTAAGFLLNSGFAIVIVDLMGLPAWLAALPMIAVTPLVVFALLKTRVFS